MPRIRTASVALPAFFLAALLCGGDSHAAVERQPGTDAGVRAFWKALDARWNERDAARFSDLFTEDVSFEFVDRGESLDSRTAVREYFEARFPTFAPELRHRTSVRDVRSLAPDVIAVDGSVEILRAPSSEAAPELFRTFAIFAVMLREPEGWKVRVIRIFQLPALQAAATRSATSSNHPRPAETRQR